MICKPCAWQADIKAPGLTHPKNCGCDCQHMDPGAWRGTKDKLANERRSKK